MANDPNQEYANEKFYSESPEDLIGRLLFKMIGLQGAGNAQISSLAQKEEQGQQIISQFGLSSGLQRKAIGKLLFEIKNIVKEKKIDFSEVLDVLEDISGSNSALRDVLESIEGQHPEICERLSEMAEIMRQNKPQGVDFNKVIESQKSGYTGLGKLIISLTEAVKQKGFPKSMKIAGPIEISKPSWWKSFEFSWEPLKELLEKLKEHTFSVKVENHPDSKNIIDSDALAKKIGKEFEKAAPKFRGGGMGNPFNFDGSGNLKVTGEGEESYKFRAENDVAGNPLYIGYAEPNSETSLPLWQIRKLTYDAKNSLLTVDWANGNRKFENIWDNRENLTYL